MPVAILYLLKLSISLSLIHLFYQLLLRRLTFYNCNRWYLSGYSLLSFIIPLINITHFFENDPLDASRAIGYIPVIWNGETVSPGIPGMRYFFPGGAWNIVSGLLLLGSATLLMRLVVWCLSIRKIRQKAKPISGMGMPVYQVDENIIPFSFGRAIYINQHLHTDKEWSAIILHEYVHVRQRHSLDILLAELLCIINWYNPFAWLIRRSIRQNLEFIADDKVLKNGLDKKGYQYHLLKVVGKPQYRLANNFNFSSLKKRIIMMNKIKSAKLHLVRFLFVLPLLAVLLLAFRDQYRYNAGLVSTGQHAEKMPLIHSAELSAAGRADTVPKNGAGGVKNPGKLGGSLDSLHKPLFIVDGVVMTEKWRPSDISASDIESIDVLKDEKAIREYGEKARNGVVRITTRHGKQPLEAVPPVQPVPAVPPVAAVPAAAPVAPVPPAPAVAAAYDSVKMTTSGMVIHQDSSLVDIQFSGSGTAVSRITDGRSGVINITGLVKRIVPSTGIGDFMGLVILDGKEISGQSLREVKPETIQSIDVWKGEQAIQKYGEKGKNGVILVTSKK